MTPQKLSERIGIWLTKNMDVQSLTYASLAEASGLDATTISTIARHGRDVRMSTFVVLCRAMKQDPTLVLKGLIK